MKMSTATLPEVASAGAVAPVPAVASAPSVKPPPAMYQNAVSIGEKKAAAPRTKTFLMGIISGCHIGFGALLAVSIGGHCPGLLATNPGLQKIIFGAFGGLPVLAEDITLLAFTGEREAEHFKYRVPYCTFTCMCRGSS